MRRVEGGSLGWGDRAGGSDVCHSWKRSVCWLRLKSREELSSSRRTSPPKQSGLSMLQARDSQVCLVDG